MPTSMTRAKFYISGLTLLPGQNAGVEVKMSAVSRGDRNALWANATPCGNLTMTINNPSAVAWWEDFMHTARSTGKQPEMFIDIYPSEDGWPGDGHKFRPSEGIPKGNYGHDGCGECGMPEGADITQYDHETNKNKVIGKAHPNG